MTFLVASVLFALFGRVPGRYVGFAAVSETWFVLLSDLA